MPPIFATPHLFLAFEGPLLWELETDSVKDVGAAGTVEVVAAAAATCSVKGVSAACSVKDVTMTDVIAAGTVEDVAEAVNVKDVAEADSVKDVVLFKGISEEPLLSKLEAGSVDPVTLPETMQQSILYHLLSAVRVGLGPHTWLDLTDL
jgi:hypothetical protein